MKIRTDFVTNSSSSSFVAVLELQLENGKKVRATRDNSNGEDDVISYFPGSYRFPGRSLADMKGCYVKNPDQVEKNGPDAWLKIVKGSLRLMCHTYGEEAYRAYPDQMLPGLGYEWNDILKQTRKFEDEDQLFAYLRGLETLQEYSDKSLRSVAKYILTEEINDALIIQRLNESGSLSLSVETASYWDDSLFSLREPHWRPEPSRKLEFITEEEYLRAKSRWEEAIRSITAILDANADVTFMDKHFVLSGFADEKETVIAEIKKRGGYIHGGMVKKADYVVISLESVGTVQQTKIKEALMWRKNGSTCAIISDDQLEEALKRIPPVDPEILLKRESDALQQKAERQAASQRAAMERIQRQAERRQQYEAKQQAAAEKQRLADEARKQKKEAKQQKQEAIEERRNQKAVWWNMRTSGVLGYRDAALAELDRLERQASDILDENNPQLLRRHIDDAIPIEFQGRKFTFSNIGDSEALASAELERLGATVIDKTNDGYDYSVSDVILIVSLDGKPSAKRKYAIEKGVRMVSLKRIWEAIFECYDAMDEEQRNAMVKEATSVKYNPGEEPENIRKRLDTLFAKLDGAYPDKKISRLYQDHKRWGETVTEFYRLLGYPDGQAFLEAYGYTVIQNAGGRPSSIDPAAIIEELRRRYPNGGAESMDALKNDNPDIPWKSLNNNARTFFGNTLAAYLKEVGILRGGSVRAGNSGEHAHLSQISMKTEEEVVDYAEDASVITQNEIKTSSPSGAEPQQPAILEQPKLAEKAQEDRAYYGDHSLNRVIIPEGCERIGNGTFGMSSLTDIQIPASVRSIGSMAFCGLLKIGAITIPEGVRALGNMVFSGSNSLKSVVLPTSLESVGKDIFYGCESLEKVTMPQVTYDRFKDEAWLQAIEGIIGIVPSTESDTEDSISKKTTAETDEDSWIQAIVAETPLQDEEILYLRTIHQLFQSADTVRMIDVAKRLEQGTGKVSYWMKKLREKGILDTTPKGVITMLKPAQSKKDETKEEATEDGSAASVGSLEMDDDSVISADDVDGADHTGEELEAQQEVVESVQDGNGLEPEAQEQPIEEEPDVIPEGPDSQSQRRRERPTDELLEAIDVIRRRYPEGTSEADMKALKQKNPDIPWQMLAGNAKRVLGKPLVPYLEDIGILRKENADQQAAVVAEPENDERVQREAEERAERKAEERARREAEEQAQREAEEQARREAIEAARQEKIRSIKSQIDDLKAEMNATGGLFGAFKRKKIQAAIDELNDQLNKL